MRVWFIVMNDAELTKTVRTDLKSHEQQNHSLPDDDTEDEHLDDQSTPRLDDTAFI